MFRKINKLWYILTGVAILGLSVTYLTFTITKNTLIDQHIIEVDNSLEKNLEKISTSFRDKETVLDLIGKTYAEYRYGYQEFKKFTDTLLENNKDLRSIGIIRYVKHSEREEIERYTQEYRNDTTITFKQITSDGIVTSVNKSEYAIVFLVEPIIDNSPALLLDLTSQESRNKSFYKVKNTLQPSSTSPINLVQETGPSQPGILIFYPMYYNDIFIGTVNGVYSMGDFMIDIFEASWTKDLFEHIDLYYDDVYQITINEHGFYEDPKDICSNYKSFPVIDNIWSICVKETTIESDNIFTLILIPLFTLSFMSMIYWAHKWFKNNKAHEIDKVKQKTKNQFISYIFHEIRVPLNSILIGIENIRKATYTQSEKIQIKIIQESIAQTSHVLNDILDLNRIENGKFTVEKKSVDFLSMVNAIFQSYKTIGDSKHVKFSYTFDERLRNTYIMMDSYRISQCINNLLSNAFKFTSSGESVMMILSIDIINGSEFVKIEVRDTGCGISEENKLKIFKSYTQLSNQTEIGSGLGLVITTSIIELHGGKCWVESIEGKGSSFYITFPYIITTKPEVKISNNLELKFYDGNRILVVDDNRPNGIVLSDNLRYRNINVDVAENGKIAVDMVKENKYNLIVMDKHMPIMDGIKATKMIKDINPDIPIVGLSGAASLKEKKEFMDAGVIEVLVKPLDMNRFNEILDKYLLSKDEFKIDVSD